MDLLYSLRKLFGKDRAERELEEEVRFHIEMSVEQKVANGMDPEAARKEALREFGGVEQVKEEARASWGLQFLYTCWLDIQFGWRQLMKNKKHTAIIVLTLAVCMGANTTAYNLATKLVSNPYKYHDADRIAAVGKTYRKINYSGIGQISVLHFKFIEDHSQSFSSFALYDPFESYDLDLDGRIRRIDADRATSGIWDVTGVQPLAGRFFTEEDVTRTDGRVIVLGERLWNELRTPENDLIGEDIVLDGDAYEVMGVVSEEYYLGMSRSEAWIPFVFKKYDLRNIDNHSYYALGRLKPGISEQQVNQELKQIYRACAEKYPREAESKKRLKSTFGLANVNHNFIEQIAAIGTVFRIIQLVTLAVLIIGCLNVAGMIMVRSFGRLQEFAMRRALGASLGRLARQMFIEVLLYFLLGGLGSLLMLKVGYLAAESVGLDEIPWAGEWSVDYESLWITVLAAGAASLLTGLLPIVSLLRKDLLGMIKSGGQNASGSASKHRTHAFFVVVQVAMSILLLAGTGLLIRNLNATLQKEIGFSRSGRVGIEIPQPRYRFGGGKKNYLSNVLPYQERILEKLRAMPGVISASACNRIPISLGNTCHSSFTMHHYEYAPDEQQANALRILAHPGYFKTVGTRLMAGRDFRATDTMDAELVAIVSQSTVDKYYKDLDPIGMQIRFLGKDVRIIGVAEQVQDKPFFIPAFNDCALYFPFAQWHNLHRDSAVYVAHVKGDPEVQLRNLEQAIREEDPQATMEGTTFNEEYETATFAQWLPMRLSIFFAVLALFLTGLGLYGLISFIVAERTKEYGIRKALGAQPSVIVKSIVSRSGRLIGWGLGIELLLAGLMGWKINPLLADINTAEPFTFIIVAVFVCIICLLAVLLPARRATQINPMEALRAE